MTVHFCNSTGSAYDRSNADDGVKRNDTLVIIQEKVVGVAWAWPVAVTVDHGNLHTPGDNFEFEDDAEREGYKRAVEIAQASGLEVNPIIEKLLVGE